MTTSSHPTPTDKKTRISKNSLRYMMWFIVGVQLFLFVMALLFILDGSPIALLPEQVSILGDLFFIVLVLCPLMLCALPLYLFLGVSIFGIMRLDAGTTFRFRKLQKFSKTTQTRTKKLSQSVGKGVIQFNAKSEFLRPIFKIFDRPKDKDDDGKQRELEE